jgi:hypothetical protein
MNSWLAHVDVVVNDSASTRGSALPAVHTGGAPH